MMQAQLPPEGSEESPLLNIQALKMYISIGLGQMLAVQLQDYLVATISAFILLLVGIGCFWAVYTSLNKWNLDNSLWKEWKQTLGSVFETINGVLLVVIVQTAIYSVENLVKSSMQHLQQMVSPILWLVVFCMAALMVAGQKPTKVADPIEVLEKRVKDLESRLTALDGKHARKIDGALTSKSQEATRAAIRTEVFVKMLPSTGVIHS